MVAVINPYLVGDVAEPLPTSGPAADPQNRITLGRTVYLDPNRAEVENAVSDLAAELAARYPTGGDRLPPGRSPTPPFPDGI